MEPTKACRTVTDIGETARKHESIIPSSLLAAHALTGCDSACCFHSSKKTGIKVMKQRQLCLIGDMNSDIKDVVSEATKFIGDCYGMPVGEIMSDKR